MSVADIAVALAPQPDEHCARTYAIEMARAYKAHLTGVCYSTVPEIPGSVFPEFAADLIQQAREKLEATTALVRTGFIEAARAAAVSHEFHEESCPVYAAVDDFARRMRTVDYGVLMQHSAGLDRFGDLFLEAALFHSGRPAIVVPRDFPDRHSTPRVLIAWDGTAHASRAVAGAMPLLRNAEIEVFTVEEVAKGRDFQGQGLVQHLRRHGLNAGLAQKSDENIAHTLLMECELFGASLLVMGAYGHSRLREFVFGGVTRHVLSNARVPVLLAH